MEPPAPADPSPYMPFMLMPPLLAMPEPMGVELTFEDTIGAAVEAPVALPAMPEPIPPIMPPGWHPASSVPSAISAASFLTISNSPEASAARGPIRSGNVNPNWNALLHRQIVCAASSRPG